MQLINILRRTGFSKSFRGIHYFISTPIFYVNADPHIGHLYSATIADATCRYQQMKGKRVTLSTGTDEHGLKIQQAAIAAKKGEKALCDEISAKFKNLFDKSGISYTHYMRTTSTEHRRAVEEFWKVLKSKGYIYLGEYEGWYCTPEESFLTDSQLLTVKNSQGEDIKVSAESGHPVQWTKETNYMFKLSQFQGDLINWLKQDGIVEPPVFQGILRHMLQDEMRDVSVSRQRSRLKWGIPVPGDESQVIYVWLDALINYLTAVGYPNPTAVWPPDCHVIGKDILKFHGIYWPAFLMAAGLELPKRLFCHSHWTVDNVKMSKSMGNVVNPMQLFEKYEPDMVRYFLLRQGVPHSNGNFSVKNLSSYATAELADNLGNLLGRCTGAKLNPRQVFPQCHEESLSTEGRSLLESVGKLTDSVQSSYEDQNFYQGLDDIVSCLRLANKFFEDAKPWEMKKNPERNRELDSTLYVAMETLRVCSLLLQPVIPSMTKILLDRLGISDEDRCWDSCATRRQNKESSLGPNTGVLVNKEKLLA